MRGSALSWLSPTALRVLAGLGVFLGFGVVLLIILLITETAINVSLSAK